MPLFDSQFTDPMTDVIGYREHGELVAFSLMKRLDDQNVLASQFAWTYHNPRTRLGIESLKTECAIYRDRGFNTCTWIKHTCTNKALKALKY
jgi:hypothetical protein